ncbi:hypothetical protein K2173_007853 [Erythroxylum novogranatense]|uniref:Protein kinase domain-containing protein n=1 Tax=Erythroxylum novogranatense TaxID=1862640 RepID=A0AAV8S6Z8_9ROSI|nr:hypothetical protein K2173_007853 [Erythroxylum novogranatense]
MWYHNLFLVAYVTWNFLVLGTHQLQSSQRQVLLQLRKHLEYPNQLQSWDDRGTDFCRLSSSTQLNVTCQDNFVTELVIMGEKPAKLDNFVGFAIPNQTLSESFSMDSFVATLARLTSLKVLRLEALGIWGPLPDKIHRLSSLEHLDLSSNYLFGSIPPKISTMTKLQTLILDHNYFNDTVPQWFDSLSNLKILSLKNNQLKGSFPSSVQRIATLTDLVLCGNKISGNVPSLSALSSLKVLDLSGNNLDSDLPSMPKGLAMAFLSNNSFSGDVPHQYGQLGQLQHLDMSFNGLTGTPPATLFSLPNISYLNLASNMLSGVLPVHLSCGSKLQFVDISNNQLTGGLPHCLSSPLDEKVVKIGGNCLSVDLPHQHGDSFCVEISEKRKQSGGKAVGILVGMIAGILVAVMLLAFCLFILCRRFCPRGLSEQHLLQKGVQDHSAAGFSSELLTNARFASQAAKLGPQGLPPCRSFTLEEIKEATKNFDSSTVLGEGSNGKLYKGRLENGTQVTIRCLPSSKKFSIRNLKLRMDLLAKLRHPHLVCLLGHCIDGGQDDYRVNKVFLIYEYVSNGNFRAHIRGDNTARALNWPERLAALTSVAKAVHFLHTGIIPGFFNNRLKTNNILLNEHGMAKLSDYGLSIISDETGNCGEDGSALKSLQMNALDDDVYSFGFILLESIAGPMMATKRDKLLLDELASCNTPESRRKLVDPLVLQTSSQDSLSIVITIATKCVCSESWNRPSFEDILWNLQYAAQVQGTTDGEQRNDQFSP